MRKYVDTQTHGQTDKISVEHITWGSLRLTPIIGSNDYKQSHYNAITITSELFDYCDHNFQVPRLNNCKNINGIYMYIAIIARMCADKSSLACCYKLQF